MEIEFEEIKKREGNPNQLKLKFRPIMLTVNAEEEIKKICQSIKNLMSVKIIMSDEWAVGIVIASCAGWENKELIGEIETKIKEVIKGEI